ncbi:unnamed protein product [Heterobilharzia americana]|nr:unnamed protein product [Heterobilharzia americana]
MNQFKGIVIVKMIIICALITEQYTDCEIMMNSDIHVNRDQHNSHFKLIHGILISANNSDNVYHVMHKKTNTMKRVLDRNIFSIKSKNITVQEHTKHVRFDCHVMNHKTKVLSYSWFKNGMNINYHSDFQHRYQILPNGSLYLTQLRRNDSGLYTCQMILPTTNATQNQTGLFTNKNKSNQNSKLKETEFNLTNKDDEHDKVEVNLAISAWLEVQYIPSVQFNGSLNPIVLGKGGPGRLPCIVDSTPSADLIEWRKLLNSSIRINLNFLVNPFQQRQKTGTILPVDQLLRDEKSSSVSKT